MPNVTRYVISEIEARLERGEDIRPIMLRWSQKGHVRERI
jgi:hypothetical protein